MPEKADRRHPLLLLVLFTGTFMGILDVFIAQVASPSLQADLGASAGDLQWVLAGYTLIFAVGLITGGRLGDVFGRRRMFRSGMVAFTIASAMCAAAPSPAALIGARLVQGLSVAAMWPQVLSIIQVEFGVDERPRVLGIMGGVQGFASIAGQLVGGGLIGLDPLGLGWRSVFLINVPFGLVAAVVAGRVIRESTSPSARRIDLPGVALGSLVLALVAVPIVEGRELGWPLWTFVALAAAFPAGAAFVSLERRVRARGGSPLVELHLFDVRSFRIGIPAALIVFQIVSFFFLLTLYLQEGAGLTPIEAGLVFTPLAVGYAITSLAGPRLFADAAERLPTYGTLLAAVGVAATIGVLEGSGGELDLALLIPATLPIGFGMGLFSPTLIGLVLRSVPTEDAGSASGVLATAQQLGLAFGVALVGSVFFSALGNGSGVADYGSAFAVAMSVLLVVTLIGSAMTLQMREQLPSAGRLLARVGLSRA